MTTQSQSRPPLALRLSHTEDENEMESQSLATTFLPNRTDQIRILIAEDNDDLRTIFSLAFKHTHFEVQAVSNGKQAIAELEKALPDVLVLDINMPEMSGIDVLRYIRERGWDSHLEVIVVTGNSEHRYDPEINSASLFLVKPVDIHELTIFARKLSQLKK